MTTYRESAIGIDEVRSLLVEAGYEVVGGEDESPLKIRDLESGILMTSVLEDNVLFNTVFCKVLKADEVSPEMMQSMLAADNGISTSAFKLYALEGEKTAVTLNNFCKLQAMGDDDKDDILSCLNFLLVDTVVARGLLEK
jgi:hypothetical protein